MSRAAQHPGGAIDPKPADPKHQVRRTLSFENDGIRVWEMVLRPGEGSTRHVHEADDLFVYLTPSKLALMQDNHRPPETSEQAPGFVQHIEVGSGITHSVKNVGDGDRDILVELEGASRASRQAAPQTNEA